ncbi:hypothetical protein JHD50_06125 [Sulfurimonas sp. MAG313]|nr:hypothetical protein [Sulfurimonas sp. MAG313]MDF1880887.1 hypothetical protein [Sulfurimonas sp. MAG313]
MAIDNSSYDSLEKTYVEIQAFFDKNQLKAEHSVMIVKHDELAELLEGFDVEALEEQSKDINALHKQLNEITEVSKKIVENLNDTSDSTSSAARVVSGLDEVFSKITNLIV